MTAFESVGTIASEVPVFAIIGALLLFEAGVAGPPVTDTARFTVSSETAYECQIAADELGGDSATVVRGPTRECPHLALQSRVLPRSDASISWVWKNR